MTTDSATSPRIVIKLEKRKEMKRKNTVKAPPRGLPGSISPTRHKAHPGRIKWQNQHKAHPGRLMWRNQPCRSARWAPQDTKAHPGRLTWQNQHKAYPDRLIGLQNQPHKTQRLTMAGLCGRISPVNLQNQPQKILGSPWQAGLRGRISPVGLQNQPCRSQGSPWQGQLAESVAARRQGPGFSSTKHAAACSSPQTCGFQVLQLLRLEALNYN